jgi:cytoskeletal protein CcmA (bactofilin family)
LASIGNDLNLIGNTVDINTKNGVDITGNLSVSGTTTLTGETTVNNKLNVNGDIELSDYGIVGSSIDYLVLKQSNIRLEGNTNITGNLSFAGNINGGVLVKTVNNQAADLSGNINATGLPNITTTETATGRT